ncbi:C-GCAxxG-C-C family protein [Bengtsoniella intestinalis]|uniref:C-GCAxxG-C-C family protein n=1 Tax=Bengtsoniella intestinalis TaxID=3073143 RepID=UPI00391FC66C
MNRYETADFYHKQGYNCAQSVVWAFENDLPFPVEQALNATSGFGFGAGMGEMCGAVVGAVAVLGLMYPVDPADPVGSKKRTMGHGKIVQTQFKEQFRHLRCHDLLQDPSSPSEATPAAVSLGITKHCDLMIVTAVELVEKFLKEQGKI